MPVTQWMVVDLPAPLGPRKPKKSPCAIVERKILDRDGAAAIDLAQMGNGKGGSHGNVDSKTPL